MINNFWQLYCLISGELVLASVYVMYVAAVLDVWVLTGRVLVEVVIIVSLFRWMITSIISIVAPRDVIVVDYLRLLKVVVDVVQVAIRRYMINVHLSALTIYQGHSSHRVRTLVVGVLVPALDQLLLDLLQAKRSNQFLLFT